MMDVDHLAVAPPAVWIVLTILVVLLVLAGAVLAWQYVRLRDQLLDCERLALNNRAQADHEYGRALDLQAQVVRLQREAKTPPAPEAAPIAKPVSEPVREVWPGCGPP
jgi:hypothetical protein